MGQTGQEVKRLREARGWTQAKLAVEAGMAPSAVNQIENGKRSPSASSLNKLAEALGVEVADLFPKAQSPLPLEDTAKPSPGGGLTLGEIRAFLEEHVGSSWIALPDQEWGNWWRGVSRDEAIRRNRQIRAEYDLLAVEFMATYGKADREPELVPRGSTWGDVYLKMFSRRFGASYHAPGREEAERDFKKRALQDLARAEFYATPQDTIEQALRTSAEAG
jgi:transcriptional regulator with XRE-family HTH domain